MIITTALYRKQTPKIPVTIPTQSGALTYTGGTLTPTWSGYSENVMEISGTTSAVNVGTYTAIFKLKNKKQYEWADGTQTNKEVFWSIGKASQTLTINPTIITLDSSNISKTITVTTNSTGSISAQSSNTSVATATVSGKSVIVNSVNGKDGNAIITIIVSGDNNYGSASISVNVTAKYSNGELYLIKDGTYYNSIVYGKDKFVVISNSSDVAYSLEGKNWLGQKQINLNNQNKIGYGNNMYLIAPSNATNKNNSYAYSTDGNQWIVRNNLPSIGSGAYYNPVDVCFGGGMFIILYKNSEKYFYSTDGLNWNAGTLPSSSDWSCIKYESETGEEEDGNFVIASRSEAKIYYGYNGINWNTASNPVKLSSISYKNSNNSRYFIGIGTDGKSYISQYGNNWSVFGEIPISNSSYITRGDGKFVAIDYKSNTFFYSQDGYAWEQKNLPSIQIPSYEQYPSWSGISYGNGNFVVISSLSSYAVCINSSELV